MIKLYMDDWKWLRSLTHGFHGRLWAFFLLEMVAVVASLAFVYWSKHAIDIALSSVDGNLNLTLLWVVLSIVVGLCCSTLSAWINQKTQLSLMVRLQQLLFAGQIRSVWKVFKQWHTGDLLVRINADSQEVVQMAGTGIWTFMLTLIKLIASLTFLWFMDPMLAWMILAITPLFLFSKIYFKKTRVLNKLVKQAESKLNNIMQESLRARVLVRALGMANLQEERFAATQHEGLDLKYKMLRFNLFTQGIMKVALNSGYLVAFIWGVYKLHSQQISFGTMTAFLQLVGRIQSPILAAIAFFPTFVRFKTSLERVREIDAVEQEPHVDQVFMEKPKGLRFEEVSFKYDDHIVLNNLNVEINSHEPTAILGVSGRGKTTFIRLLLALIKPDKGQIAILDKEGIAHPLSAAHTINFSYVPQGNSLFSGTIRDNLIMGKLDAQEAEIDRVLDIACAEFVYGLPQGLNTYIGESGYGLSEGQAQRVAIARALLQKGDILLLDEATSALDEATTDRLMAGLLKESFGKIVVLVTHDVKVSAKCAKSIVIH